MTAAAATNESSFAWRDVVVTIASVAEQILSRSFAVYRVNTETAIKIRDAHRLAIKFFQESKTTKTAAAAASNEEILINRYQRIVNGNLHGYNALPSKEIFRTWYKYDSDNYEEEQQQQWPSEEFRTNTLILAKDLHRLLLKCVRHIVILKNQQNITSNVSKEKIPIPLPPQKRFRISPSNTCDPQMIYTDDSNYSNNKNDGKIQSWSFRGYNCPLDYFFYHNQNPYATNCSEHTDRGVLVLVCLTDVPGLEVESSPTSTSKSSFVCPELLVHNANLYKEREDYACSDLVCIMTGDKLSQLLKSTITATTASKETCISGVDYPSACVHRVRNHLKRARLSISYELRLD